MNKPRLLFLTAFLLFSFFAIGEPFFHKVSAKSGDSISSLLARYKLNNYKCNYQQFYKLNDLDHKSFLYEGKEYYLPVMIYEYNGKSIRSTIGIEDWTQAVRIKNYNEYLLNQNLRKQTLLASKILWVPFHELNCLNQEINVKIENEEKPVDYILAQPEVIPVGSIASKKNQKPFKFVDSPKYFTVHSVEEKKKVTRKYVKTKRIVKAKAGDRIFSIFGDANAHVPLIDESLKGKVFYVVSGHGGPDAGAVGKIGRALLCEDEYAYDVSLRLVRNLIAHGATAYMVTRDPNDGIRSERLLKNDQDEYCWGNLKMPRGQKKRLFQRSDMVNALYLKHKKQGIHDQRLIAIHVDSRSVREQTDLFFYYFPNSDAGKKLAKKIHRTVKAKYKKLRPGRGYTGTVTARDLHMLRETPATSVYVELGNIKNTYDRKRILPASNRQALADWLFEGLTK